MAVVRPACACAWRCGRWLAAVKPGPLLTAESFGTLHARGDRHRHGRLADPQLLVKCRTALDELTQILKLGSVYPFQLA